MNSLHQLSDLQLAILRVLWARGEATVNQVQEDLAAERSLALTTVATVLTRIDKKGLVSHRTEGRQYVYRAEVSEAEVRGSVLSDLTEQLFSGDVTALVSHLLSEQEITPGDLAQVKALIERKEADSREGGQ
ncbi:BlaI/MecI/CopY family transcriptional regulator [bacterium]|nr:BlaI/MecI/CopY family transcriptional regulator [bacterium]